MYKGMFGYGTSNMIGSPLSMQQQPASVSPLAQSMNTQGAGIGAPQVDAPVAFPQTQGSMPYQLGDPMTNLVTPSTLGTNPVPQPFIYPNGPTPPNVRGTELPPGSTVSQTGQGGGQSTIPGASQGLPGQANTGSAPYGSGQGVPGPVQGAVPVGTYTNQSSQLDPTNYAVGSASRNFIDQYNASHQLMNLTVADFDRANAHNSETAFQMLQQGGQQFRDAVQAAHGWSHDQMARWINQVAYENPKTFQRGYGDANTFAQFGATYAQPTHYGPQGYAPGFTGPPVPGGNGGWITDWNKPLPGPSSITPTTTAPDKGPTPTPYKQPTAPVVTHPTGAVTKPGVAAPLRKPL